MPVFPGVLDLFPMKTNLEQSLKTIYIFAYSPILELPDGFVVPHAFIRCFSVGCTKSCQPVTTPSLVHFFRSVSPPLFLLL